MKTYTILLMLLVFSIIVKAQDLNKEVILEGEKPFLLGKVNKDGLESKPYQDWFTNNYNAYEVDEAIVNSLKLKLSEYQITIFMGTWCGDSKREVPRFYKILDACGFPDSQLEVIALSRMADMYKQSPNHYEAGLNIHRVPTFILYKDRKEINRIVEYPVETLEKDLLNIVTGKNYDSNYQIVTAVNSVLKEKGLDGLKKQHKKLIKRFEGKIKSSSSLNTYARILYSTNRFEEAIAVCKMNNTLFPDNARTFESLSIVLDANGQRSDAIKVLEKAIKKFPENKDLKDDLKSLRIQ